MAVGDCMTLIAISIQTLTHTPPSFCHILFVGESSRTVVPSSVRDLERDCAAREGALVLPLLLWGAFCFSSSSLLSSSSFLRSSSKRSISCRHQKKDLAQQSRLDTHFDLLIYNVLRLSFKLACMVLILILLL